MTEHAKIHQNKENFMFFFLFVSDDDLRFVNMNNKTGSVSTCYRISSLQELHQAFNACHNFIAALLRRSTYLVNEKLRQDETINIFHLLNVPKNFLSQYQPEYPLFFSISRLHCLSQ